ncbi:MAG TPA: hypothetical protein VGO81_10255 [Solirubrobacteraceae bacterium]|nr:hypothetical protein [Solirubrobacteraceae bacterium]
MPGPLAVPLLAVVVLAGCDGERARAPAATARPPLRAEAAPLCARLRAAVTGHITAPAATELSGLAMSRTQPGVLWTHNDSGDRARVLAVTPGGRLLADVALTGVKNVDWEDIAVGPSPGGGDALYVADIGDNDARRREVVVYRVPEPRVGRGRAAATAPAARLALRYPDGAHDAEALLVEPGTRALVVVTKSFGGDAGVYVARRSAATATTVLRRSRRLSLGAGEAVTGAGISADGRTIVLRTYDRARVWTRRPREPLTSALRRRPCTARADLLAEGQGEAIALAGDGRAFYTVPEGRRPAIRRYVPAGRVATR